MRVADPACSVQGGEALDEDVVGIVPVEHADPDVPRVRAELAPAPRQDPVAAQEARAVLHVLPVAAQPRERCKHHATRTWTLTLSSALSVSVHKQRGTLLARTGVSGSRFLGEVAEG
jgi:hypothetical protein